jgi:hypothetical protein
MFDERGKLMKRYNIDIVPHTYGEPPSIREYMDGKWVYADDAQAEIAKRDEMIQRMRTEISCASWHPSKDLLDEADRLLGVK